ncbi:MAG: DUF4010 domain-containing protein, partial [Halobacteria archaeon]|nr:DUF4010 domain-containing protein [Halobacteria archaeon]
TEMAKLAVGAILLADAAMALRNMVIVVAFIPELALRIGIPLGIITLIGVGISVVVGDWNINLDADFDSPFSLKNALKFGGLFLGILLISAGAQNIYGAPGFLFTSFVGGIVSSGSATTTAVLLASSEKITYTVAATGVVAATSSSILVKTAFAASVDRSLVRPVLAGSFALIFSGIVAVGAVMFVP